MRWLSIFLICALLTASAKPLKPDVTLCELLQHPEKYDGKEVTVRATHRYGFEWSYLYCSDCKEKGNVWLEILYDAEESDVKAYKHVPKGAGVVNLTVRGVFMGGGTYGHLNGYRYKFVATAIDNVAVLSKGMKPPEQEKAVEEKSACGGAHPK